MIDGPCLAASRYPYEFEAGWFGSVLVLVAGYSETGYLVVEGDAPDEATLLAAGIERATGLVATIDEDAYNVYVVLSARTLNRQLFIVGRANAPIAEARLKQAPAWSRSTSTLTASRRCA